MLLNQIIQHLFGIEIMSQSCSTCGMVITNPHHRNQRRCNACIMSEPYDFTFKQGNCTIQIHTELMSKTQLTKMMRKLMPLRRSK